MLDRLVHFGLACALVGLVPQGVVRGGPIALAVEPTLDATSELIAEIRRARDKADPKLLDTLAGTPTEAALKGLLELEGSMDTVYMRREIVRRLSRFDGTPALAPAAMKRLMDVATSARESELREAALDALGRSVHSGKPYLALIVTSPAHDGVRERAMENHVQLSDASDLAWYSSLYRTTERVEKGVEKEKRAKPKPDGAEEPVAKLGPPLDSIRRMAFEVLRTELDDQELAGARRDRHAPIRELALLETARRGAKDLHNVATGVFTKLDEAARVRVAAAGILIELDGKKVASEFIKFGTNVDSPMELRRGLASLLAELRDPSIEKELLRELQKGRTDAKLFVLHAVREVESQEVDQALEKLLSDKEPEVVVAVSAVLAARGDARALPALENRIEKEKDPVALRAAWQAWLALQPDQAKRTAKLETLLASPDTELRVLALQSAVQNGETSEQKRLVEALDDPRWSIRLAALRSLELVRDKETISAVIARMAKEEGRMLEEFASTLWRLTGQPYGDHAEHWAEWWRREGATFELLSESDFEKVESSAVDRGLRQTTGTESRWKRAGWRLKQKTPVEENEFFGIRIASHRVLFLIDVSISMQETLAGEYAGESGVVRMDVAKKEMAKCLEKLESGAFFNVLTFCGDVDRWKEGALAAADPKHRAAAASFVGKLKMCGGTNLYDTVVAAFEDDEVDTLYIMSDGEPTSGAEIEPLVIREAVARMNAHRGIEINTIAIGGSFQILKWLAEDSLGTHVKYE